jgi:hypothetical protein
MSASSRYLTAAQLPPVRLELKLPHVPVAIAVPAALTVSKYQYVVPDVYTLRKKRLPLPRSSTPSRFDEPFVSLMVPVT